MFLWNYPQIPEQILKKIRCCLPEQYRILRLSLNYRTDQLLLFTGVENRSHKDDRTCFAIFNGIEKAGRNWVCVSRQACWSCPRWPRSRRRLLGTGFVDLNKGFMFDIADIDIISCRGCQPRKIGFSWLKGGMSPCFQLLSIIYPSIFFIPKYRYPQR